MGRIGHVVISGDAQVTIVVTGSLDLTNSDELGAGLLRAAKEADSVNVDLTGVIFADSSVLAFVAQAAVVLKERGKSLSVLVAQDGYPQRLLKILHYDQVMEVVARPRAHVE